MWKRTVSAEFWVVSEILEFWYFVAVYSVALILLEQHHSLSTEIHFTWRLPKKGKKFKFNWTFFSKKKLFLKAVSINSVWVLYFEFSLRSTNIIPRLLLYVFSMIIDKLDSVHLLNEQKVLSVCCFALIFLFGRATKKLTFIPGFLGK